MIKYLITSTWSVNKTKLRFINVKSDVFWHSIQFQLNVGKLFFLNKYDLKRQKIY